MLKLENKYCVYLHRNSFTQEVFYVGIGNNQRPYNTEGRSLHWKRYVAKYGRTVHILFENLSWSEAGQIESYLIRYYGRIDIEKGPLVNRCDGGAGAVGQIGPWKGKRRPQLALLNKDKSIVRNFASGWKHTEATKKKMSDKKKGGFIPWNKGTTGLQPKWSEEQHAKRRAFLTGRKHSEETKRKMSEAGKGKPKSDAHKEKLKGLPKSDEHKRKLSESKKGKPVSEKTRAALLKACLDRWAKIKNQGKAA